MSAHALAGAADTVDAVVSIAVCAVVGLAVGSFLNVVIARVPEGRSVIRPGSRCPRCGAPIAPRDNVPVVSWLLLHGRARCCGGRIPVRYPLVELGTGAAFAVVAAWATTAWTPSLLGEDLCAELIAQAAALVVDGGSYEGFWKAAMVANRFAQKAQCRRA